ncbi:MAG: SH3 domain-containing protein [Myxococcota bacterium]
MKPYMLMPLLAATLVHCNTAGHVRDTPTCQAAPQRVSHAPRVADQLRDPASWIAQLKREDADRVLLSPAQIEALNARNLEANRAAFQDVLDPAIAAPQRVKAELGERLAWLDAKLESGAYHEVVTGSYSEAKARLAAAQEVDALHITAKEADIRCVPMNEGLFTQPVDTAFDRNRCSRLHVGEVIRVLRTAADGAWLYVHAGHSVGWLYRPELSPAMQPESTSAYLGRSPHVVVTDDITVEGTSFRMGRRFPGQRTKDGGWALQVPTVDGTKTVNAPADAPLHLGAMPLTRATLWRLAMARLGEPYGWGGYQGGRDCSRLLMDLFSVFGVRVGRHSLVQAHAGSVIVDMKTMTSPQKLKALREAATSGVALVYMPGHVMLHLGEVDGRPYALSSISEFVTPCAEGDQVMRLDQVTVSDYELGRDTKRTAFIERITTLSIFGGPR